MSLYGQTKMPELEHIQLMYKKLPTKIGIRHVAPWQWRIQPASLGRAISAIFGSQVPQQLHYCKGDEV